MYIPHNIYKNKFFDITERTLVALKGTPVTENMKEIIQTDKK